MESFEGFKGSVLQFTGSRTLFRMSSSSGWPLRSCKRWSYLLHGLKPWVVLQVRKRATVVLCNMSLCFFRTTALRFQHDTSMISLRGLIHTLVWFVEVLAARIWPKARSWGIYVLDLWCYAWTSPWFFDNTAGAQAPIYWCFKLRQDVSRCPSHLFPCISRTSILPNHLSKVLDDHWLLRQQSLLPYSEYHCLCQWYKRSPGPQLDPRQLLDS